MRLAVWSTGYARGFGGTEQMANALLRRFAGGGVETLLITDGDVRRATDNPYFTPLPAEVERYIDTFPNPLLHRNPVDFVSSVINYLRASIRLFWFLRTRAPTVVHLQFVSLDVFLLVLLKYLLGFRLIVTFCGGDLTVTRRSAKARMKVRTALRCADAVSAVSRDLADRLRKEFGARSVAWIPNGIDCVEARAAAATVAPSMVQPDHFVYVGRLHPDKRVPLLVNIFKKSVDAGCDRNLYLIGDGPDREGVCQLIARHGLSNRIIVVGAMTHHEVLSTISRSRCLVLTSSEEGCPNVVLEAMALGRPVIAPSVGDMPMLVEHGHTGWLFPADDHQLAMEQILRIARDPLEARAMGDHCAEIVGHCFDLGEIVRAYVALYGSFGEEGSRGPWINTAVCPCTRSP